MTDMDTPLSVQTGHSHTGCFSTGTPQSDGALNNSVRIKIRHYLQLYTDKSDPIVFLPVTVSTSGHVYDVFVLLLFLHSHSEVSILAGELPEESDQFRFW